ARKTEGEGSEIIVDAALEFIRQARDGKQPFLAVVWFGSPHDPHQGTPLDLALYADQPKAQQHFLAEITAMDRAMGKLRRQLRELGVAGNTVLWYCSDNGAIKQGSTGGLRGGKNTVWEGGLRVPGLLEWPARFPSPRVIDVPCGTVDIFPTLLELAGSKPPDTRPLDGISLVPLLEGRVKERPKPLGFWHYAIGGVPVKSTQLLETLAKEQAEGKVRPAAEVEPIPATQLENDYPADQFRGHSAWLEGDWKLHRVEAKTGGEPKWELCNLATDRTESRDLAGAEPARVTKMKRDMDAWLRSVVASLNGLDYR
nr:sulfatase-like hydrolase/transferase [Verrucomicrobiota bacterium]